MPIYNYNKLNLLYEHHYQANRHSFQVLDGAHALPEATPLQLLTQAVIQALELERCSMLNLQMSSFIRGDEDEEAETMFVICPDSSLP